MIFSAFKKFYDNLDETFFITKFSIYSFDL
jgi:hypothetical protein